MFNDDDTAELKIQGLEVHRVDRYKYIGMWIKEGADYLNEHANV